MSELMPSLARAHFHAAAAARALYVVPVSSHLPRMTVPLGPILKAATVHRAFISKGERRALLCSLIQQTKVTRGRRGRGAATFMKSGDLR